MDPAPFLSAVISLFSGDLPVFSDRNTSISHISDDLLVLMTHNSSMLLILGDLLV